MKGYKIFDANLQCRGFQYKVGAVAETTEKLEFHKSGLHFCTRALDCLRYYSLNDKYRYAEVEAVGVVKSVGDICVTDSLLVVRELSCEEFAALCSGVLIAYGKNGTYEWTYEHGQISGYSEYSLVRKQ